MKTTISFIKTISFTIYILLALGLSSCTTNHYEDGKLIQNVSAEFRVGGFLGTDSVVKIKDAVLLYRTTRRGNTREWQEQTLSNEDIAKLENKLKALNVVNWNKKYIDPRIMDGTHWSIQYSSKKLKIKSSGSNKYPESYKALISYISKTLLKGKPF